MIKTMVKPRRIIAVKNSQKECELLPLIEAASRLGITRVTVYRLMAGGWLIPEGMETIGARDFVWFKPEYIYGIAKALPPVNKRGSGKSILNEDIKRKIRAINKEFYPNKSK